MSRIRTIKPEFWQDEDLSMLPPETHMLAAALLNYADDEGYFKANPKLVKAACCPLREDSVSIHESLGELSNVGYIRLGTGVDGKRYGHICGFTKHQRVNRPSPSKIKQIDISWDSSLKTHGEFTEGSPQERNREQGKDKDSYESSSAKVADCPHQQIIDAYEELLPMLPRVRRDMWAGSQSAEFLKARWREDPKRQDINWWRKFFERIRDRCPHLLGHSGANPNTGKVWHADLRWIVKRENFTKILEGRYLDKGAA